MFYLSPDRVHLPADGTPEYPPRAIGSMPPFRSKALLSFWCLPSPCQDLSELEQIAPVCANVPQVISNIYAYILPNQW